MATHTIPPTPEELDQKLLSSPLPPLGLNPGPEGCLTQCIRLMTGSRCKWLGQKDTLSSWRSFELFTRIIQICDLCDIHTLEYSWKQPTAFRLPVTQAEVSGWYEAPHRMNALCHQDFLSQVDSPGTRGFHSISQEETLALTQALQWCMERSGMPPRVLCKTAQGPQRCMATLMWLDSDEIMEASLLGPADERPIMPPTAEEEAVLLGNE